MIVHLKKLSQRKAKLYEVKLSNLLEDVQKCILTEIPHLILKTD